MTMLETLETAFAEFDAANAAKSLEWAKGRVAALRALKVELADERRAMGEYRYYDRVFAVCGGKTWYNVFNNASEAQIADFMAKNSKAIADKRNATIVAKLTKIGVTDIGNLQYSRTNDGGFNGVFSFEGASIEIRTIGAGGYNIQCYHERTLVYANNKRI